MIYWHTYNNIFLYINSFIYIYTIIVQLIYIQFLNCPCNNIDNYHMYTSIYIHIYTHTFFLCVDCYILYIDIHVDLYPCFPRVFQLYLLQIICNILYIYILYIPRYPKSAFFFCIRTISAQKRICLYKNVFVSKTGLCWVSVRTAFLIKMTKNLIRPSSAAEMPAPQGSGIPWRRFAYIIMQIMSKTLCPPIIQALI